MRYWLSGFETARLDTIVAVESMVVNGMVLGLTSPILGFYIMYLGVYGGGEWRCVGGVRIK
jgi:hypothetical protein